MIDFYIYKIRIKIDFTFFFMLSLVFFFDIGGAAAGIAACFIHELGHLIIMKKVRIPITQILFYGAGIRISAELSRAGFSQQLAVLSAGCIANILSALVFASIGWYIGAATGIATALFNLLCLGELDGAAITRLFCGKYLSPIGEKRVFLIMRLISGLSCAATVFLLKGDISFTLLTTLGYILFLMAFD